MGPVSEATPSATSQLMLDQEKVGQQLLSVQAHLEDIVRTGLYHMRKDDLWKRMLYGSSFSAMQSVTNTSAVSNGSAGYA